MRRLKQLTQRTATIQLNYLGKRITMVQEFTCRSSTVYGKSLCHVFMSVLNRLCNARCYPMKFLTTRPNSTMKQGFMNESFVLFVSCTQVNWRLTSCTFLSLVSCYYSDWRSVVMHLQRQCRRSLQASKHRCNNALGMQAILSNFFNW